MENIDRVIEYIIDSDGTIFLMIAAVLSLSILIAYLVKLGKEYKKNKVIYAKFLLANTLESNEELKKAYNLYYSLLNEFPNTEVIKKRLSSIYNRRIARKR